MSWDGSFDFVPLTPPEFSFADALGDFDCDFQIFDRDSTPSQASVFSQEPTSPSDTIDTHMTTPLRSPVRQYGPLLLPKIRLQDQEFQPPAFHHDFNPTSRTHQRSLTNPEALTYTSDIFSGGPPAMSTLCSPIHLPPQADQHKRASSASLDDHTLTKYGFPTYRQMPAYVPAPSQVAGELYALQNLFPSRTPSPFASGPSFTHLTPIMEDEPTTTLLEYLTTSNPAPALVHHLNYELRDQTSKHFWWDIRQVREWKSFSVTSITEITDLHALLTVPVPSFILPTPPRTSLSPQTETELQSLYATFYTTKLNAALQTAQGPRHIMMKSHPHACRSTSSGAINGDAAFSSSYIDENRVIEGRGLGRVVGLVKSFDRWNTGMRTENGDRRVQYLRGLAHLHGAMREHGCRYGFIVTEIELLVARNGSDDTPHFGYLEVATIQLAAHAEPAEVEPVMPTTVDLATLENNEQALLHTVPPLAHPPRMTALLALWYLHMLARDAPLPSQPGWKSHIGAPAEGTRRKCMPKDRWIPEPHKMEKREAGRARGWIWPEDAVMRKEIGRRAVRYGSGNVSGGKTIARGDAPIPCTAAKTKAKSTPKTRANANANAKTKQQTQTQTSSTGRHQALARAGKMAAAAAAAKMMSSRQHWQLPQGTDHNGDGRGLFGAVLV